MQQGMHVLYTNLAVNSIGEGNNLIVDVDSNAVVDFMKKSG
jgi:hypothetical protein